MLSLLTVPSSTEIIAAAADWANPFLDETWITVSIAVGCFAFGAIASWLVGIIIDAISHALNRPDPVILDAERQMRRSHELQRQFREYYH